MHDEMAAVVCIERPTGQVGRLCRVGSLKPRSRPYPGSVQDTIHVFRRRRLSRRGFPRTPKCCVISSTAIPARSVACRQSNCLVEEEQLGPVSAGHHVAFASLPIQFTRNPRVVRPSPVRQVFIRAMEYSSVASQCPSIRDRNKFTSRKYAILQWHGRMMPYAGFKA